MAATLTGCSSDFLDKTPESDYVADKYYNSDAAVVKAIEPLYNRAWHEFNRRSLMAMGSIRANDAWNPYVNSEFARFQLTGLDEHVAAAWSALYTVVSILENTARGYVTIVCDRVNE